MVSFWSVVYIEIKYVKEEFFLYFIFLEYFNKRLIFFVMNIFMFFSF